MSAAPEAVRPWPGLNKFTRDHKFCGRTDDLNDLFRRLRNQVGTVLYGQSGLGKSSLLDAGLVPRLQREHYLPVDIRLIHKTDAAPLIDQVRESLRRCMSTADLFEPLLPADGEDLWRFLHRRDVPWLFADGHDAKPVLIFDQFEEIFTNGQATPELARRSKEFFNELADLVQGRPSDTVSAELAKNPEAAQMLKQSRHDYHILIVLREDYLPHLDTAVERFEAPDLVSNRQRLLPFDGHRAMEAVEGPGEGVLDEGVAEQIVRKVASARQRHISVSFLGEDDDAPMELGDLRVEPALLSLLCSRLNEARLREEAKTGSAQRITTDLVKRMGSQVLDDYYQESITALPERARAAVSEFIEDKLISESGLHRQQVVVDTVEKQLGNHGLPLELTRACIKELVEKHRLLRIEDRGDVPRLELTHDVLCEVVGRCRERRRAWQQRLKLGKNIAAVLAVLFFISSLLLANWAWKQRTIAVVEAKAANVERSNAEKERLKAETAARDASKQKAEAEKNATLASEQKTLAEEATKKARSTISNWYQERITEEAEKYNYTAAAALAASAREAEALALPVATGYITAEPLLQFLRTRDIGEPAELIFWSFTGRELFVITNKNHVCCVGDSTRWLVQNGPKPSFQAVAKTKSAMRPVEVVCGIPWKDEKNRPGILVSLPKSGLSFLPDDGSPAEERLRSPAAEVTALAQSPADGSTWAGFASGLTVRLKRDAKYFDWSAAQFSGYQDGYSMSSDYHSLSRRWWYRASKGDSDRIPSSNRYGRDEAEWEMVFVPAKGENRVLKPDFTEPPRSISFSPDERWCLIRHHGLTLRYSLLSADPGSKKASATQANGDNKDAASEADIPSKPLPGESQWVFLDNEWLIEAAPDGWLRPVLLSELKPQEGLRLFEASKKPVRRPAADDTSSLFEEESEKNVMTEGFRAFAPFADEKHVAVVITHAQKPPQVVIVAFARVDGGLKTSLVNTQPIPVPAGASSRLVHISLSPLGGEKLMMRYQFEGDEQKTASVMLAARADAKFGPVVFDSLPPVLPGRAVRALAFDTLGGTLCVLAENGAQLLNGSSGHDPDVGLLTGFTSSRPLTLSYQADDNAFIAHTKAGRHWHLGSSAFGTGKPYNGDVRHDGDDDKGGTAIRASYASRGFHVEADEGTGKLTVKSNDYDMVEQIGLGTAAVNALSMSPDGRILAAGDNAGRITILKCLDADNEGIPIFTGRGISRTPVHIADLGNDHFVISDKAGLHEWEPRTGEVKTLPLVDKPLTVIALSKGAANRPPLALVETDEGNIVLADARTAKVFATGNLGGDDGTGLFAHSVAVSRKVHSILNATVSDDGDWVALLGPEGIIEIWNRKGDKLLRLVLKQPVKAKGVAFQINPVFPVAMLYGTAQTFVVDLRSGASVSWNVTISAAASLAASSKFLVSQDKAGLKMLSVRDPLDETVLAARLEDVPPFTVQEASQLIVDQQGLIAVASKRYDTPLVIAFRGQQPLVVGGLKHGDGSKFEEGGIFSADASSLIGLSMESAHVWRPAPVWSATEARDATGLIVDSHLRTQSAGPRKDKPLPPRDDAYANALAAALTAERSYQALRIGDELPTMAQLREALSPLADIASETLPPIFRTQIKERRLLISPAEAGSRQAMELLDFVQHQIPSGPLSDEWQPVSSAAWPIPLSADFQRWRVAVRLHREFKESKEGDSLLSEDKSDLRPDVFTKLEPFLQELEQSFYKGGLLSLSGNRMEIGALAQALNTLKKAQPEKLPEIELQRRLARVEQWLDPANPLHWNTLGFLDLVLGNEAAKTPNETGHQPGEIYNSAAYDFQVSAWLSETQTAAGSNTSSTPQEGYLFGNWANALRKRAAYAGDKEARELKLAAMKYAREATERDHDQVYGWLRLYDNSLNDEERLKAINKVVQLRLRSGSTTSDTDRANLIDARQKLGTLLNTLGRLDESIEAFDALLSDTTNEVYPLVEIGDMLARGAAPASEWQPPFDTAMQIESKMMVSERDHWGRRAFGDALLYSARGDEARAAFVESIAISKERKISLADKRIQLGRIAIDANDLKAVTEQADLLAEEKLWSSLALLARRLKQIRPQAIEQARQWAQRALDETADNPDGNFTARMWALDTLGRTDEALALLQKDIENALPDELTEARWHKYHINRASLTSGSAPLESQWQLAQAVAHAWMDHHTLLADPGIVAALKDLPAFRTLQSALAIRFDSPQRYLELARFILESAAARRAQPGGPAPAEELPGAARMLAQAVRQGWVASDADLLSGPFQAIKTWSGWPAALSSAREDLRAKLRRQLDTLSRVLSNSIPILEAGPGKQAWNEFKVTIDALSPDTWLEPAQHTKLWNLLNPAIKGYFRLKQLEGKDVFGNPIHIDLKNKQVRLSPKTEKLIEPWAPKDEEEWSAPFSETEFPTATAGSKPGRAISPYPPNKELDVTGLPSGSLALDPTVNKVFRVP